LAKEKTQGCWGRNDFISRSGRGEKTREMFGNRLKMHLSPGQAAKRSEKKQARRIQPQNDSCGSFLSTWGTRPKKKQFDRPKNLQKRDRRPESLKNFRGGANPSLNVDGIKHSKNGQKRAKRQGSFGKKSHHPCPHYDSPVSTISRAEDCLFVLPHDGGHSPPDYGSSPIAPIGSKGS